MWRAYWRAYWRAQIPPLRCTRSCPGREGARSTEGRTAKLGQEKDISAVLRSTRFANTIAILALLFALAGTAGAAAINFITGAQVQDGSLTGADLANHSISFGKLTKTTVNQLKGARGPAGPAGQTGAKGAPGAPGADGAAGGSGPAGTGIRLAAREVTDAQTLPDDLEFHTIWSVQFQAAANQVFIPTGQFGGESTPGCPDGDFTYTSQLLLDGSPLQFNGALLTVSAGTHTLSYEDKSTCSVTGFPVHVPAQEFVLIPFTLP